MTHHFICMEFSAPFHSGAFVLYSHALGEMRKAAIRFLGEPWRSKQHDYREGGFDPAADDILLGLITTDPAQSGALGDWMRQNAPAGAEIHPNNYLLFPGPPADTFPQVKDGLAPHHDAQMRQARLIIAAQGRYWFDRWRALDDDSVYAEVRHKVARVNCGCDAEMFPHKHKITRRSLLHVSNLSWCKNPDLLYQSVIHSHAGLYVGTETDGAEGQYVSHDGKPFQRIVGIGGFDNSNRAFNDFLLENCDFYIHTSRYDAQSTALLESCARGLVPLVTPESGFSSEFAITLTDDPVRNGEIIDRTVGMSETEYAERSRGVRAQVLEHHGWASIFGRINDLIARDQRGEPVAGDDGGRFS